MIPIEKEKQIRELLTMGWSLRQIAAKLEISRTTVKTIKECPELRKRRASVKKTEEFQKLKEPRKCKICGAKMKVWPCILCHSLYSPFDPNEGEAKLINVLEAYAIEALELFRIIQDLRSLNDLHLIENPLFVALARRADNSFNRILLKDRSRNAAKKENKTAE